MKNLSYLEGKTIENAYYNADDGALTVEFTDGIRIIVSANDLQELSISVEKD